MNPARPFYHRHGNLKNAVVRSAVAHLDKTGEVPTLRELAREVGVSATALYRHFLSHADVLYAVALEGVIRFLAQVNTPDDYVAFAQKNPAMFRLIFNIASAKGEASPSSRTHVRVPLKEAQSETLRETLAPLKEKFGPDWPTIHGKADLTIAKLL